ncbi:MAG: HAD family phosphatase [Candidatus Shapirobacteria bacterium]|nr:HAD family phosphatase [Candidatus Shapirobacteria bacterium]
MKKSKIKLVLFDYDGVIVDPIYNVTAWKNACASFNFFIDDNDWYINEGLKPEEISLFFLKKYKIKNVTVEELVSEKNKQYKILLKKNNKVELYNNVCSILSFLKKKGIRIGLVTGSTLLRVTNSIPEIKDFFDVMVTADSLDENNKIVSDKRFSTPWLFAAKKLNIPVNECIVIENASLGVNSAKKAGMFCIAIQTTLSKELLKEADLVIKDHKQLFSYLKKMLNKYE